MKSSNMLIVAIIPCKQVLEFVFFFTYVICCCEIYAVNLCLQKLISPFLLFFFNLFLTSCTVLSYIFSKNLGELFFFLNAIEYTQASLKEQYSLHTFMSHYKCTQQLRVIIENYGSKEEKENYFNHFGAKKKKTVFFKIPDIFQV